jgi:hypothetical protein
VRLIIGHSYAPNVLDENTAWRNNAFLLESIVACRVRLTLIFKAENAFFEKAGAEWL